MIIRDLIGKDRDQRSVLAETVAAGTFYFALYAGIILVPGQKAFKLISYFGTAVGKTARAAAYTDSFHLLSLLSVRIQNSRQFFHGHFPIIGVIYDHDRRKGTGSETVHEFETEKSVLRGLPVRNAEDSRHAFHKCHGSSYVTGCPVTQFDDMPALRFEGQGFIEGRHGIEGGQRYIKVHSQSLQTFPGNILEFMLQILHDGQTVMLVRRIRVQDLIYFFYTYRQFYYQPFC